jgi:PPOX class probable F420-dependent enzyme
VNPVSAAGCGYLRGVNIAANDARARFEQSPTATLGTVDADGQPHLVPVTYVLTSDDHVYIAIDGKPKRTTDLKRLRNIAANPQVSLLVSRYADDWEQLWWARADGAATVTEFDRLSLPDALPGGLLAAFQSRYPWYRANPPAGPVIDISVTRWSGWAFAEARAGN